MRLCDEEGSTIGDRHIPDLSQYHEWLFDEIPRIEPQESTDIYAINPENHHDRYDDPSYCTMIYSPEIPMYDLE